MFCKQRGLVTDLSKPAYRSCSRGKCGGWQYISSRGFNTRGSARYNTGAWLPVISVCTLYKYKAKIIKPKPVDPPPDPYMLLPISFRNLTKILTW